MTPSIEFRSRDLLTFAPRAARYDYGFNLEGDGWWLGGGGGEYWVPVTRSSSSVREILCQITDIVAGRGSASKGDKRIGLLT